MIRGQPVSLSRPQVSDLSRLFYWGVGKGHPAPLERALAICRYFFWFWKGGVRETSPSVSHAGGPQVSPRPPTDFPTAPNKKPVGARGYSPRVSGGRIGELCVGTVCIFPAGLQSHCTVSFPFRQYVDSTFYFYFN